MSDSLIAVALGSDAVREVAAEVDRVAAFAAFGVESPAENGYAVAFNSETIEIVALRSAARNFRSDDSRRNCKAAFELDRAVISGNLYLGDSEPLDQLRRLVRAAAFGVLGDSPAQVRQLVAAFSLADSLRNSRNWGERLETSVFGLWLLVFRKRNWDDIDLIHSTLADLRAEQSSQEPDYLEGDDGSAAPAWRLVALYHLLRASEIIAEYLEAGEASGHFDPVEQSETHFDRARAAAERASDIDLVFSIRLIEITARQIVDNSIWRVARGAGVRIAEFVRSLVSRDRQAPFLELLPPQRRALAEEGLIATGRRAIVVSLPTSAGKTLIAEFRLLQALDSYESVNGWCVYTVPTRALVNQIASRLRRDLGPLGIRVEKVSPALEVDSVEEEILRSSSDSPWRVLVSTPEKLDLLLRGGWATEVNRPLSLVIVDEAHNLGSGVRGLKLELLLATINREARDASFLLLTPFVPNAEEVASWLDPLNNQTVELGLEWLPNDRVIGLSVLQRGSKPGDSSIVARTIDSGASSLHSKTDIPLADGRPFGRTWSKLKSPGLLAAATAHEIQGRGATVVLVQRPDHSWSLAKALAETLEPLATQSEALQAVCLVLAAEYGENFPLVDLVGKGVGVHHGGIADDIRGMLEILAERDELHYIVATTTLAQGINFPIANVVMATNQYPYGVPMPHEDFWNIAGRAGRADHGQPGVVLLCAPTPERADALTKYVGQSATHLNSTLIGMVTEAIKKFGSLDLARLSFMGDWSAFVQFISHTYRMVGADEFATQVENILRGTLGYRRLREDQPQLAQQLMEGVRRYSEGLIGQPLSLVDATGFSLESVSATLGRMHDVAIGPEVWTVELFDSDSTRLKDAIGVLLRVPELREQLVESLEPSQSDGDFLARVVKDWVAGWGLSDLASTHFSTSADGTRRDPTAAITVCCQRLFGNILPAVSWGLSALQALTSGRLQSEVRADSASRDLSSFVFYGVRTPEAVALRLFGVPRGAAPAMATYLAERGNSTEQLRSALAASSEDSWREAMGDVGAAYFKAWRLVEPAA